MTRFMSEKLKALQAQVDQEDQDRELQLHKAKLVQEHAPLKWQQLCEFIQEDVKQYNRTIPQSDPSRRVSINYDPVRPRQLSAESQGYAVTVLDLAFTGTIINCTYQKIEDSTVLEKSSYVVSFAVDKADNGVYFRYGGERRTPDQLAFMLLDPLLPITD